jgi:hypothetical protein
MYRYIEKYVFIFFAVNDIEGGMQISSYNSKTSNGRETQLLKCRGNYFDFDI